MFETDIRWKQRFTNFTKAYTLLYSALRDENGDKPLSAYSDLEKEGIIQRFEFTFELLWKTLKDFLVCNNIEIEFISPSCVLKTAALSGILENANADGELLIEMMKVRNEFSHRYNFDMLEPALIKIQNVFLSEITHIYEYLRGQNLPRGQLQ